MVFRTNTYNNRDTPFASAWNALAYSDCSPWYLYDYFLHSTNIPEGLHFLQENVQTFFHDMPEERAEAYSGYFTTYHPDKILCTVWVCKDRDIILSREHYGMNLTSENQGIIRCSEKNGRVIFQNNTDILLGFEDPPVFIRDPISDNLISQEELERVKEIERTYELKFKTNLKKDVYNLFRLVENGFVNERFF